MEPGLAERLGQRLGPEQLARRQRKQRRYSEHAWTPRSIWRRPEHLFGALTMLRVILVLGGMWRRGRRNFRDLTVVRNDVSIPGLPAAFDGFSLLQFSDLHLEIDPLLVPAILQVAAGVKYDLAVFTGDYSLDAGGRHEPALALLAELTAQLPGPKYGILGNHDFVEITPRLEAMGIAMLLNEHVCLRRDGEELYLAGVDDIWYYDTADAERALAGIPADAVTVMLAHNPDFCRRLSGRSVQLLLAGHTHGGQVCLPGGTPVITHTSLPRAYAAGAWTWEGMSGYTCRGAGGSGQPVRFNCRPELALHVLHRA